MFLYLILRQEKRDFLHTCNVMSHYLKQPEVSDKVFFKRSTKVQKTTYLLVEFLTKTV